MAPRSSQKPSSSKTVASRSKKHQHSAVPTSTQRKAGNAPDQAPNNQQPKHQRLSQQTPTQLKKSNQQPQHLSLSPCQLRPSTSNARAGSTPTQKSPKTTSSKTATDRSKKLQNSAAPTQQGPATVGNAPDQSPSKQRPRHRSRQLQQHLRHQHQWLRFPNQLKQQLPSLSPLQLLPASQPQHPLFSQNRYQSRLQHQR